MSKKLVYCTRCEEPFDWDDEIIAIDYFNDKYYHRGCVELYPQNWAVFVNDECIGEVENESSRAFEVLGEGEYIEQEDE